MSTVVDGADRLEAAVRDRVAIPRLTDSFPDLTPGGRATPSRPKGWPAGWRRGSG